MKKQIIKVHLLKKGIEFEDALKNDFNVVKRDEYSFVYDRESEPRNANKMIETFLKTDDPNEEQEQQDTLYSSREKMLISRKFDFNGENRIFILSIGDTRSILDVYKTELNFGIKLGINYSIENEESVNLKEITSKNKTTGDNFKQGKNSFQSVNLFAFRNITEIMTEAKMKQVIDGVSQTWTLSRAISFPLNEDLQRSEILGKIEEMITTYYPKDHYKTNYSFLDEVSVVEPEISEKLFNLVNDQIGDGTFSGGFSWPGFESEFHEHYKIGKSEIELFSLERDTIIDIIKPLNKTIDKINVVSYGANGSELDSKTLDKLIFGEVKIGNDNYSVHDGNWYLISEQFSKKIEKAYSEINIANIDFPVWGKIAEKTYEKEGDYNERVCKKENWTLLDKKNIHFSKSDKLEVADIAIASDRSLVAVKKGDVSSGISHLSQQVKNSVLAIENNLDFVNKQVNTLLKAKNEKEIDLKEYRRFILAIATEKEVNGRPDVPFFGKIALYDLMKNFKSDDFEFKLSWIKIQ